MDENRRGEDIVNEHWPVDGPHSEYAARQAALAMGQLSRYLNYATLPEHREDTLPDPAAAAAVIGAITYVVEHLPQLFDQMGNFLQTQANRPGIYVSGDPKASGASAARLAAMMLDDARGTALGFTTMLADAQSEIARLGVQEPASSWDHDEG